MDLLKREKITTPFSFGAPCLVCKKNQNNSSTPGWSGLVAIVRALATRELGCSSWVGRWNDGGLCAVLLCCSVMSVVVVVVVVVSVSVVLLFVYACASWCALSSKMHGARSRVRDAFHRRQHCWARIEDRAYCGVKLHLAACCSLVGRWDDGGLGAVLLLRCCVVFVVAVVVVDVVFPLVFIYVCLRVLVCSVIRGTALGHPCGMPPTGANNAILLLKTWLAPDSTYT